METINKSQKLGTIAFLTIIGFLSGFLSAIFTPDNVSSKILPGILFGLALSAFFIIAQKEKSIYKIIGFVAISVVAYNLAVSVTINTPLHVRSYPLKNPIDPTLFFSGGIVGALVLLVGLKFLLTPLKWSQLFLLTIFGGLLGTFSWMVGSFISPTISTDSWEVNLPKANMYSLYIIWQTAMAFAISVCMKFNQKSPELPLPNQISEPPKKSQDTLVEKMIATLGIILFLSLILGPVIQRAYQTRQENQVAKQYGPMPQENPVVVHIFSADEMLINKPIGDYLPNLANSYYDDKNSSPHYHEYQISYQRSGNQDLDLAVNVTQYATSEWAKYKLKDIPFYNAAVQSHNQPIKINKFNNTIFWEANSTVAPGGDYYWQSGNKIIQILFYGNEVNEFLKQYLEKYPSSL